MSQSVGPVLYATRLRMPLADAYATLMARTEASVSIASRTLGIGSTARDGASPDDEELLPPRLEPAAYAPWLSDRGCLSLQVRSPQAAALVADLRSDLGDALLGAHTPTEMCISFGPHHVVDPASGRRLTRWRPAIVSIQVWGYSTPLDCHAYERALRRSPALASLRVDMLAATTNCRAVVLYYL